MAEGVACPLCKPRPASNHEWDFVAALGASSLYLNRNQTYRGHCLLIFDPRHAARPDELSEPEWASFCADLFRAQGAIMRTVHADHINIEALGNVVPHLHWHIVPRYRNDPRWGAPIWAAAELMRNTSLGEDGQSALIEELRRALGI